MRVNERERVREIERVRRMENLLSTAVFISAEDNFLG